MSATEPQRLALHAAARTALGEQEGDTLMALVPPANTDIALRQDVERLERVFRSDLHAGLAELRAELRTEFNTGLAELRTELHTGLAELRTELHTGLAELRTELHTGLAELRTELHTGLAALRVEFKEDLHRSQLWTIGILLTAMVALQGASVALLTTLLR